ncbi:response regulator [Bosea sp. F3-2]|uniref:response regulator n=1 Tax=Bosea sp. F3-2 TaxID=2599640 RepID=UPI0011ED9057|nr:response regulator [Bosea sp. F3-2]QEL24754.1 response regulator [Bosea sp. F3-2]
MTAPDRARLIVVDDEADIRDLLTDYLTRQGFAVRTVAGGAELDAALAQEPADLILLDLGMPGEDGLSITRRLRKATSTPIVLVTGAGEVVDRVIGLEVGADDYVTKPFDLRELKARIRSVIRRTLAPAASGGGGSDAARPVSFGRLLLNPDGARLTNRDGAPESMTPAEFQLLSVFAAHPNKVLSRETLLEKTAGSEASATPRSIDIRITRLRVRIEQDPAHPLVIRTVRGAGYIYVPDR